MTAATGRPVVVSGASSGIGLAVALELARARHPLLLLGRDRERLDGVAEEAARLGAGVAVSAHAFDLTDDDALVAFATEARRQPLGGVVHSAGMVEIGRVEVQPVASLDAHYRLNLRAPYLLTQQLLPALDGGTVVFVNSGSGLHARAEWSQYAATKFALRALADSLREELEPRAVRVSSIYPGRTATPMQRALRAQEGGEYRPADYVPADAVARQVLAAFEAPDGVSIPDLTIRAG